IPSLSRSQALALANPPPPARQAAIYTTASSGHCSSPSKSITNQPQVDLRSTLRSQPKTTMADKCGNCDCADKTQCV
uniref:Uncharacterized protein n=1 Tax=Aegilops tauschii subsp. strangulata TaxID=200361 RepID=A0A453ED66_AEGTS